MDRTEIPLNLKGNRFLTKVKEVKIIEPNGEILVQWTTSQDDIEDEIRGVAQHLTRHKTTCT